MAGPIRNLFNTAQKWTQNLRRNETKAANHVTNIKPSGQAGGQAALTQKYVKSDYNRGNHVSLSSSWVPPSKQEYGDTLKNIIKPPFIDLNKNWHPSGRLPEIDLPKKPKFDRSPEELRKDAAKRTEKERYEEAINTLSEDFGEFDIAAGQGWKDGKIGEKDLKALQEKLSSNIETLTEKERKQLYACDYLLENNSAVFNELKNNVNEGIEKYVSIKDVATAKARMELSSEKPSLDEILENYQAVEDEMVTMPFVNKEVTQKEADLLNGLNLLEKINFNSIHDKAFEVADERFNDQGRADGHNDACRHAYWNALMTRTFGAEWAEQFATAHEGRPGDSPTANAMDLYNNEVGRRIALANPNVSDKELATLIEQAIRDGQMLVINAEGNLDWSNNVKPGETGHPG